MNINIDWAELREQKAVLLDMLDEAEGERAKSLAGVVNLIDAMQDEAAATLGEQAVFWATTEAYLADPSRCPRCASGNIEASYFGQLHRRAVDVARPDVEHVLATQDTPATAPRWRSSAPNPTHVTCIDCDAEWWDEYRLMGYWTAEGGRA